MSPSALDKALFKAVLDDNYNRTRELLDQGADVNQRHDHSADEYSPLAAAIGKDVRALVGPKGNAAIVKLLLDRGADPEFGLVHQRLSPLMLAARANNLEAVRYLLAKGAHVDFVSSYHDDTALQNAAERGHIEIMAALVEAGADVNQVSGGSTPIFSAIEGGLSAVQFLVDKGADLARKSKYGNTPLALARKLNQKEIVEFLRKAGAEA